MENIIWIKFGQEVVFMSGGKMEREINSVEYFHLKGQCCFLPTEPAHTDDLSFNHNQVSVARRWPVRTCSETN